MYNLHINKSLYLIKWNLFVSIKNLEVLPEYKHAIRAGEGDSANIRERPAPSPFGKAMLIIVHVHINFSNYFVISKDCLNVKDVHCWQ